MERKKVYDYYDTIVIGAGAGGLFFGAARSDFREQANGSQDERKPSPAACTDYKNVSSLPIRVCGEVLILEKTKKAGTKLLMSGSGQCNITHGGSIKEFLSCYGENGKKIRSCLYRHNNIELRSFLRELGVATYEREDGKVFPVSMSAKEVRDALLTACAKNAVHIRYEAAAVGIEYIGNAAAENVRFLVRTQGGTVCACRNLVIAAGGSSYPSTGSDGELLRTLHRDLPQLAAVPPRPALVPVFVENYPFTELSGISFHDVEIKIFPNEQSSAKSGSNAGTDLALSAENTEANSPQTQKSEADSRKKNKKTGRELKLAKPVGDLLLTHKNFSGPVILNNSNQLMPGSGLEINFIFPYNSNDMLSQLKKDCSGNRRMISGYIGEKYALPKNFINAVMAMICIGDKPLSQLTGKEMSLISDAFAKMRFTVTGTAGFKQAMATAGGISLDSVTLSDMQSKEYPGLYFIGEVLDIDGNTGGYNLQFAYSSAMAVKDAIYGKAAEHSKEDL